MEQIRIKRGIEVGVNDNGDSIFIDAENTLWVKKYKLLTDKISKIASEVEETKVEESDEIDFVIEKMNEITSALDEMFGENACKKVFGDIVPSPVAVIEFFSLLTPIVEKYSKERNEQILSKYSTKRKGGK